MAKETDVIAHVMLQFPISLDNIAPPNDWYGTKWNWNPPTMEGTTDWRNRGGYIRERVLPIQVGEHPLGIDKSVVLPLSDSAWSKLMWQVEIRRAKARGIGGFMPDMQQITPGNSNFNRCLDLCAAAYTEGTFAIMLCPDLAVMTTITAAQLATAISSCYTAAGPNGAALKKAPNGNVLISPYLSAGTATQHRDATFWNAVQSGCQANGFSIAVAPVPNGTSTATNTLFDGLSMTAGYGVWGERNPGTDSSINGLAAAMRARTGNASKIFLFPVSARDARHRDMQFDENWGSAQLITTLEQMNDTGNATGANDIIVVMTWNDLSETSGICLTDRDPDGTWGRIAKPYFDLWRAGTRTLTANLPIPSVDEVFVIARNQQLAVTVELSAPMNAGTAYTAIPVKNLTQIPTGENTLVSAARDRVLANKQFHTREGEVMTVSTQPAVNGTSIPINSFTPTITYGAGTVLTLRNWTYDPPVGTYKPSVNRGDSGGSVNCTPNKDEYEILTRLSAPGDLQVTDPGSPHTWSAPAGQNTAQRFTVVPGAKPYGTLTRGGVTQMTFAAREDISATPSVQDVGYYPAYFSNPPTATPQTPSTGAARPIRQLRSTKAKLTARNGMGKPGQMVHEWDTGRWKTFTDDTTPYKQMLYDDEIISKLPARHKLPDLALADSLYAGTAPTITAAVGTTPTTGYIKWAPPEVTLAGSDKVWQALRLGGGDFQAGTSGDAPYVRATSKYPHTYASAMSVNSIEFDITSRYLQWLFKYMATSATFRLSIDGRPLSHVPTTLASVGATTTGSGHLMTVDFGSAAPRRIRIDMYNVPNGGFYLPPTESMNMPPPAGHRLMAYGDSLTDGAAPNTGSGMGTWFQRFARMAGFRDAWNEAIGGTGYINAGTADTLPNRVAADVVAYAPTDLIIWAGYNDTANNATVGAVAQAMFLQIQTALPACRIMVVGCWAPYDTGSTNIPLTDTALRTAAAARGLPFVSPVTGSCYDRNGTLVTTLGRWIYGTGKAGALNNSGNSDSFIGSDGVHANDAGHAHIARRMYASYVALLP